MTNGSSSKPVVAALVVDGGGELNARADTDRFTFDKCAARRFSAKQNE